LTRGREIYRRERACGVIHSVVESQQLGTHSVSCRISTSKELLDGQSGFNPPEYSLRRNHGYNELKKIVATIDGHIRQTITA
jgi:hypothetical protein